MKRKLNGQFSRRKHYKLPEKKIKPVLMWYYACLGVGVSCYLIGGAFYECFQIVKTKFYETKRIVIINEVGAGTSDRDDAVSRETEQVKSEVSEPVSIEQKIKEVFGEEAETAIAIAKAESSFNPSVIGDTHLSKPSIGLFQISLIYHDYTVKELLDPERNIEIAKQIYDKGGWCRWTTYKNNRYLAFL